MADDFLELDINRLDEMWLEQPQLYHKYAKKLANAKQRLEEEKAEMDVIKSELDRDIRKIPENFGLEKITETVVANTIIRQDKFMTAQERVIDLKHEVDIYQAAVNTLEHRKRALENLVTLFCHDYYSNPRAKDVDSHKAIEEIEKTSIRRSRKPK